ncbi:hypothetical protein WA158_004480 [Blastocystis sp. Blastoise]
MDDITERYERQIKFDQIGIEGQKKLAETSVLCIGCGGLGSSCILYLAGCGIGKLTVIDNDIVELSNLHRQLAHTEEGAKNKLPKAISMKNRIESINSNCQVTAIVDYFSTKNAIQLVSSHDIIIDCCDNIPTRYVINDACILCNKPFISAATQRWSGQLTIYGYKNGPCFRCLNPNPPPLPDVTKYGTKLPVIPPLPGMMGCYEALEAIKLILNIGIPLSSQMFFFDGETNLIRIMKLRSKQDSCVCCNKEKEWNIEKCHHFIQQNYNRDMGFQSLKMDRSIVIVANFYTNSMLCLVKYIVYIDIIMGHDHVAKGAHGKKLDGAEATKEVKPEEHAADAKEEKHGHKKH